jgi:tight adherence protein B
VVPGIIGYMITQNLGGVFMLAVPGLVLPRTYVKIRQYGRIRKIDAQLVDALIMVSNSLKSGYSFLQGMELVAEEAPNPIAQEFRRMLRETNLGYPLEQALDGLSERVPSEDLDLVVTVIKIHRLIGGNLAEILDKIVHTIRDRIKIKGEISTLTAQGKLQGIILTLLPPAMGIGIYMMNPEFMTPLFTTILGKLMLGVAFVLQMIGGFMIKKIVEIRV